MESIAGAAHGGPHRHACAWMASPFRPGWMANNVATCPVSADVAALSCWTMVASCAVSVDVSLPRPASCAATFARSSLDRAKFRDRDGFGIGCDGEPNLWYDEQVQPVVVDHGVCVGPRRVLTVRTEFIYR
jgi:hypothetical protein